MNTYQKSSIEQFLIRQKVRPAQVLAIRARIVKVADERGAFLAQRLNEILGEELAEAYRQACAKDPGLLLAGQKTSTTLK